MFEDTLTIGDLMEVRGSLEELSRELTGASQRGLTDKEMIQMTIGLFVMLYFMDDVIEEGEKLGTGLNTPVTEELYLRMFKKFGE